MYGVGYLKDLASALGKNEDENYNTQGTYEAQSKMLRALRALKQEGDLRQDNATIERIFDDTSFQINNDLKKMKKEDIL